MKITFYNTFDIAVPILPKFVDYMSGNDETMSCTFVTASSRYRGVSKKLDGPERKEIPIPDIFSGSKAISHFVYLIGASCHIFFSRSDVSIFFTQPPFGLPIFCLFARLRRKKYVVHVMDYHPSFVGVSSNSTFSRFMRRVLDYLYISSLKNAAHVVAIGECMEGLLTDKGVQTSKISTIRNISSVESLPYRDDQSCALPEDLEAFCKDRILVLYAGNQGIAHEFSTILSVSKKLRDTHVFVFIGSGHRNKEIRDQISKNKLDNVRVSGFLEDREFENVNKRADLHFISLREQYTGLMVPSKFYSSLESGSIVLFEGHKKCEISRCIEHHDCGFSVPSGNELEMLAALRATSESSDDELGSMRTAARELYYEKFCADIFCYTYHTMFKKVCNEIEELVV